MSKEKIQAFIFSLFRSNNFFFHFIVFRLFFDSNYSMKIRSYIYIFLACFLATFLRIFINNNFIVSIIGSFILGLLISKRLSYSKEKIIFSGFFSCFTSFSGYIYFLYKILHQGDWIKFILLFNSIIIINLITMYFGFWISRKIS